MKNKDIIFHLLKMFPVRCFSCGKCIGKYELKYNNLINDGNTKEQSLNILKINRYCCRRMFLSYVEINEQLINITEPNFNLSKKDFLFEENKEKKINFE